MDVGNYKPNKVQYSVLKKNQERNNERPVPQIMKFDPVTGKPYPYPSEGNQYRHMYPKLMWIINPYTGIKRDRGEFGMDPFGLLLDGVIND